MQRKIAASGATVLELVVLRDSSRGKVQVHDPRRVRQGTLTSALTWGVFGWLAGGGWSGLAIWAVIGAVCGGLYAYYTEHVLTKGQLARIAARLPRNSSALVAFVDGGHYPHKLITAMADFKANPISVASVDPNLAAHVTSRAATPDQPPGTRSASGSLDRDAAVSMLLFRYPGAQSARKLTTDNDRAGQPGPPAFDLELILDADRTGALHAASPTQGVRAMSRSDVVSWGLLGVIYGASSAQLATAACSVSPKARP